MSSHRILKGAFVGALGLGILGAGSGLASPPQSGSPGGDSAGGPTGCVRSVRDQADPAQCLGASSVPELGSLYPISQELFVDAATGNVGIGTTFPAVPLTVRGIIGVAEVGGFGFARASIRPSQNDEFGVIETFTGGPPMRTVLIATSSVSPDSGAMATQQDDEFLTLITTPANDAQSGYMSVLSDNLETAGMNGGTGIVFGASKSFVQPHPDDATKEIQYVSMEGPEHGVYFRGTQRLAGGEAVLEVPESFRLVARAQGLTVSLTPLGPSAGLYVAEKGLERIVVRENPGSSGDVSFDFLVMGVRSAMPEHVAIRDNVHFAPEPGTVIEPGRMPGEYRELMIQNGTLDPDGAVSMQRALDLGWRHEGGAWASGPAAGAPPAEGGSSPSWPTKR